MNKVLKRLVILILYLIVFNFPLLKAQCTDFHLGFCPIPDFSYYYNQQSKSMLLKLGQTAELKVIVYENNDYFISICKHRKYNTLQFRILEDNETRDVLYDNASNAYSETIKFVNQVTRKLILEVSLPVDENDPKENKPRCIGILLASRLHEVDE